MTSSMDFDFSKLPEPTLVPPNARDIGYSSVKLWTEFQMLRRLVYRSRNQHRAAFSFHRLQEVKRTGERVARLELWLKANYTENLAFIGFLNALRIQIEKGKEATMKAFYYYMQYLDQALFPQLALLAVGSVSVIYKELCQWLKYVHLLYNSMTGKLLVKPGMKEQFLRHNLPQDLADLTKTDSSTLNTANKPNTTNTSVRTNSFTSNSTKPKSGNPQKYSFKQLPKKSNSSKDEIDDIFDLF